MSVIVTCFTGIISTIAVLIVGMMSGTCAATDTEEIIGLALSNNLSGQLVKHGGSMNASNQYKQINQLWEAFTEAIDRADVEGKKLNSADGHAECNALHDYSSQRNPYRLASLHGRETANERQHRRISAAPNSFTVGLAAKLHIMSNAAYGATLHAMPSAHLFLTVRPTAIESEILGYLCRAQLSIEWRNAVSSLDYSKLMENVKSEF